MLEHGKITSDQVQRSINNESKKKNTAKEFALQSVSAASGLPLCVCVDMVSITSATCAG